MAHIKGTDQNDWILGTRGDDLIEGLEGNDRINERGGNNEIYGNAGDDRIIGWRGNDVIDGGPGNDRILALSGDDVVIHRLSENQDSTDCYSGGYGVDTLCLILTQEEFDNPDIQADIARFQEFIADRKPDNASSKPFHFSAIDLTVRNFEKLEIKIDSPEAPSLSIGDASATEGDPGDATSITFTVTRTGSNSEDTNVVYTVIPGTATNPEDYNDGLDPISGTLTFTGTETIRTITLDITDDQIPEGTETFTVVLSDPTNGVITDDTAVGTINDDDLPTLAIGDASATEGDPGDDTSISFTVTRSGSNDDNTTVVYTVVPGSATNPEDYNGSIDPITGTLTFTGTETTKTITLDITDDELPEGVEEFTVVLSDAVNANITDGTAVGTINDDDLPTLAIGDASATEGDPGDDTSISFTVTRSGSNDDNTTVVYTVVPGSATNPEDYNDSIDPITGTLTFTGTETTKTITLDITDDELPEGVEEFTVELSDPTNGIIEPGAGTGTGTILDDDLPILSIGDASATEGDPGDDTSITFKVMRTGNNGTDTTVVYTVVPGSATFPEDYNDSLDPIIGTLTFTGDETTQTITLDITDDQIPEGAELFTVELSDPTNGTIEPGAGTGTGTILDDDLPILSIGDASATEGDPGDDTSITFTVMRTGNNGTDTTVVYTVVPGSATFPEDYNDSLDPITGTLTFTGTETTKTITLDITDDELPEGVEEFTVVLSDVVNATITNDTAVGTINDDDLPTLAIGDAGATEGDPGDDTSISFTVTRSGSNDDDTTVVYTVVPGSAINPEDYNDTIDPITGTLTFTGTETTKTITLDITDDELPEGVEEFTVVLSDVVNATITDDTAIGTINDDDLPTLAIGDASATEGDPGDDTSISFTVTRSGSNDDNTTVVYTVVPGSATNPEDYNDSIDPITGTLTFTGTETTKTITLDITDDQIPEGAELFTVELSDPTNGIIEPGAGTATGTILDDDLPILSIGDASATEGDPGDDTSITFTVMRTGNNGTDTTVVYTVVPGSATFPEDYNDSLDPIIGTLTFTGDETTQTITLDITDDQIPEGIEQFTVVLSDPTNATITNGTGTGTIIDVDEPRPTQLSIDDQTVTEGNPGGPDATITFTVTRTGDKSAESTVFYTVVPGSATFPEDYNDSLDPLTGILTFIADDTSETITLDITDDQIPEGIETFTVMLSNPTNAVITDDTGVGTISDNDDPLDTVIWTSSDDSQASIGIGVSLNVGTDNSTGTPTDHWTNSNGDRFWSTDGNWEDGTKPISTDRVALDEVDSGGINFVDQDFEILSLDYTGAGRHITDVISDSNLQVSSFVSVGIDNPIYRGSLRIEDVGVTAFGNAINVGQKSQSADTPVIGQLTLTADSGFSVQTTIGDIVIGNNQTNSNTASGELDALESAATVNLDFDDLIVGFTRGTGVAQGTLRWNQEEAIHANDVYFGWGSNALSVLDVPAGGTFRLGSEFDRVGNLWLAYNDTAAAGSLTSELDFTVTNPTFETYLRGSLILGEKTPGAVGDTDGSLRLGSNSTLDIQSTTGDVIIGENLSNSDTASGELDALESAATVNLDFDDLIVGFTRGTGVAQGTLRWNQEEAIHANDVYFGWGSNALSVLDVPAGGTFRLGSELDRVGNLWLAYNDTAAAGSLTSELDFTVTNPTFETYLRGSLILGEKTPGAVGDTDGSLRLGSNSTLDIQSTTGDVIIGENLSNSDTASGELDALESAATVNLDFDDLIVGFTRGTGVAQGTLRWNQEEAIHANDVYFGWGSNALSVLDVPAGGTFRLGSELDRVGNLWLAYNDTAAAGSLTSELDFTVTNPTFETYLRGSLILGEKTPGAVGDTDGSLRLGSNSTLDIQSTTGDVIIGENLSNSDTASGELDALESAATVNLDFDDLIVGFTRGTGVAQGTLRWNQEEAIHANDVYFGWGSNALSVLDVPAGGTFRLGSELDRVGNLWLAYNDTAAAGSLTSELDFTVTNPTFETYLRGSLILGEKTPGAVGDTDGSLRLGSNSTLDIQSTTGDVIIGENLSNSDTASGELDALESAATVNLDFDDLIVGFTRGTGVAQGTLRWNQEEAIHANDVYFGWGSNALSVLDVPAGGTFRLGSELDRVGNLWLAYNDTAAAGSLTSELDFTVTNPTFETYLRGSLILGEKTPGAVGDTDGSLRLGSNSTLDIQSTTGDVIIGENLSNSDTASGELDALESAATVNLDFDDLIVGFTRGTGVAQGTLRWNQEEAIHANDVYFGWGSNALSVLDVPAGGTFRLGSELDRVGNLWLAYNDTAAAGSLTSELDFTVTNPTFETYLRGSLILGEKTPGAVGDTDGSLRLGSNSTLDIQSTTGDVIIGENLSNSDTASGELDALESAATVNLDFDDLIVGFTRGTGVAQGTLRWNQEEAIHANDVYFGWGSNALSVLDVPAGGTFRLGSELDRVGNLWLAYNDTAAAGSLTSELDFTVTNPTFETYLRGSLILGEKTPGAVGDTDGSLRLGSNSTLDIQSTTGDVIIGENLSNSDTASGELDALESAATVNLDFDDLIVGFTRGTGVAQGTLRWNQEEAIHANDVYFGWGSNALSVLDVPAGGTFRLGSELDRVGNLWLAYNDTAAAGSLTSELDFTVTNPTFETYLRGSLILGEKTPGAVGDTDGSLRLGSNSTLDIQSTTGDVIIGENLSNSDTASGELDALESAATVNLDFDDLIVGFTRGTGVAQGTLRWNQEEAIHANDVYFGWGSNALSVLDVPAGGTFRLGSELDRVGNLWLAYNDTAAAGSLTSELDFTVTNPTFETYLRGSLILGEKTPGAMGDTDAALTLGSNSTLDIQSTTGDVFIGYNRSNGDTVIGELDATQGVLSANLDQFNVGVSVGTGIAIGAFTMGDPVSSLDQIDITANQVNIGSGSAATGTFNLRDGFLATNSLTLGGNGNFSFTGGRFEVTTFNGTFDHDGGTFGPKGSPGNSTINGDYNLESAGILEIEIENTGTPGTDFDQLEINGLIDLNADTGTGGTLDLLLDFTPTVGNSFTVIDNDGNDSVTGTFNGLDNGGLITVVNGGDEVTFQIDYNGGSGNDVVLTVTEVLAPAPGAPLAGAVLSATAEASQALAPSDKNEGPSWLAGGESDESFLFDKAAGSQSNLDWNPYSPLGLMMLANSDGATKMAVSNPDNPDALPISDTILDDDSPLVGVLTDSYGYSEGNV